MSGLNADKLLVKITHYDKDERYMCLIDICHALTAMPQNVRLEPSNESKLLKAILVVLEKDTVVDVQAVAVRTLSLLVTKISRRLCRRPKDHSARGSKHAADGLSSAKGHFAQSAQSRTQGPLFQKLFFIVIIIIIIQQQQQQLGDGCQVRKLGSRP